MNSASWPLLMLSGPPSAGEILLIGIAIIVLFGPKRLPELLRKAGRIYGEIRKASDEFTRQIMTVDRPVSPSFQKPDIPDPGMAVPAPEEKDTAGGHAGEGPHAPAG